MYWKSLRECLLLRANHHEFHDSVEITDPREGRWIRKIHWSEDFRVTKMSRDLVKQTRFQGFKGEKFASIVKANVI